MFVDTDIDEVYRVRARNLHLKSLLLKYAKDENQCILPHVTMLTQNFAIPTTNKKLLLKSTFLKCFS